MKAYAMDGEGNMYSIPDAVKQLQKQKHPQLDFFHADGFPIPYGSAYKQFVEHVEFC